MKYFKSILIAITLLLISGASAFAAAPAAYINEQGAVTPMPTASNTVNVNEITSNGESPTTLEFGAASGQGTSTTPEQWYYIANTGNSTTAVSNVALQSAENEGATLTGTGTLNIVVGPNASNTIAQINTNNGTWTLGNNQTINVYRAATLSDNNITIDQCYLTVANMSTTTGNAITVAEGGKLNVVSAALNGVGIIAPPTDSQSVKNSGYGIAVTGGQVTVNEDAQLQCTVSTNQEDAQDVDGLSITGGSLTNNGSLRVIQNTNTEGNYTAAGINNTAASQLINNAGTIYCSDPYSSYSTLATGVNGVWLQQSTSTLTASDGSNFNVVTGNAFGTATLNLGVNSSLTCQGTNFTLADGANLTIPEGYSLTFGTTGAITNPANATLTVGNNAILKIDNSDVTMLQNSALNNSGTIDVSEDSSTTTPSTN